MAAESCVAAILCPLGGAITGAINTILSAQIAVLQAEVLVLEGQLAVVNVQLLPIQIVQSAANTVVAAVRAATGNLVPVALMQGCVGLGDMMTSLNASIDTSLGSVNRILNEANRALSFKAELQARIDDINATIAAFGDIQVAIAGCP